MSSTLHIPGVARNTNGHEVPFYPTAIFYSGASDYTVGFQTMPLNPNVWWLKRITIKQGDELIQAWNQLTLKLFCVFKDALKYHRLDMDQHKARFKDKNQQTAWDLRIAFFKKLTLAKSVKDPTFLITPDNDPANLDPAIQAACDVDRTTIRVKCLAKFTKEADRKSPVEKQ